MTESESLHARADGERRSPDASVKVAWIGAAGVVVAAVVTAVAGVITGLIQIGPAGSTPSDTGAGAKANTSVSQTSAPAAPSSAKAAAGGPRSLIDIPLVGDEFDRRFQPGSRKVNAVDYKDVYAAELLCYVVGEAASDEYQLDRKYGRLVTKVGLGDVGSDSGIRVKFTVVVDGAATRSATVTIGEVKTIEVPVSGALRVSLQAEILEAWECKGHAVAAWVEPTIS